MADQKIHEYPIERFVYGDDDYYDIDFWDGFIYQTAKIKGSTIKSAILSGIAISLTAPSAFIVGGSPADGAGTLTLTGAGLANQYIRGDGTLATFPTSGGGGNNVNFYLNGGTPASVGTYYQMSKTAVIGTGVNFSLAGNGLISQWLTDVGEPNVTEIPAGSWNFEIFFSASSVGGTPQFYIELLKYDGVTFTTIADNSIAPESITGGTATDLYLTSLAVPLTSLLVTDRLAVRVYIVNSVLGRTITQHTQDSTLNEIITTFSSGVSSINGLTAQTQYMTVGTLGNDFNIDQTLDTHVFNLPTASALDRGALSQTDWATFNGKLTPNTPITGATNTKITYDSNGLVTSGTSATTADIAESTNKLYVSDGDKGDITVSSSGTVWDIDASTVGVTELSATGTPSATTFLRGDNTWSTPASTDPAGWTTIVKSANQDVTNSIAYVDDNSFSFSVVAGGHYMIDCNIVISGNDTTTDQVSRFTVTSGTITGKGNYQNTNGAGAITNVLMNGNGGASTVLMLTGIVNNNLDDLIAIRLIFSFTASANATFKYQFSNQLSGAGTTTRTWKGSILKYKRLD